MQAGTTTLNVLPKFNICQMYYYHTAVAMCSLATYSMCIYVASEFTYIDQCMFFMGRA